MAFKTQNVPLPTKNNLTGADNYNLYDSIDDEALQAYNEFTLATMVYYGLKEAQCSEQSSRMTAMDSASKNAGTSFNCGNFLNCSFLLLFSITVDEGTYAFLCFVNCLAQSCFCGLKFFTGNLKVKGQGYHLTISIIILQYLVPN